METRSQFSKHEKLKFGALSDHIHFLFPSYMALNMLFLLIHEKKRIEKLLQDNLVNKCYL